MMWMLNHLIFLLESKCVWIDAAATTCWHSSWRRVRIHVLIPGHPSSPQPWLPQFWPPAHHLTKWPGTAPAPCPPSQHGAQPHAPCHRHCCQGSGGDRCPSSEPHQEPSCRHQTASPSVRKVRLVCHTLQEVQFIIAMYKFLCYLTLGKDYLSLSSFQVISPFHSILRQQDDTKYSFK